MPYMGRSNTGFGIRDRFQFTAAGSETSVSGSDDKIEISSSNFGTILNTIVTEEKDPYLTQSYELIVNGKEISTDDVLFL